MLKQLFEDKMQAAAEDKGAAFAKAKALRVGEAGEVLVATPLPHRPGVVAVRLPSGQIVLDGTDHRPLSDAERRAIFGEPARKPKADPFAGATEDERAELAQARERSEASLKLAEQARARRKRSRSGRHVVYLRDAATDQAEEVARLASAAEQRLKRRVLEAIHDRERRARRVRMGAAELARFRAFGFDVPADGLTTQGEREAWGAEAERIDRGAPVVESAAAKIRRLEDRLLALERGGGAA